MAARVLSYRNVLRLGQCGILSRRPPQLSFWSSRFSTNSRPFDELPEVRGWPILGDINLVSQNDIEKPVEEVYLIQLCNKFNGTFKIKVLGTWTVVVQTPDAVEAVYRAEGKYPLRGIESNLMSIYKSQKMTAPMFFSMDEEWKRLRSSASKQVVPRRVGTFVSPMCDIMNDFISHLEGIMDDQGNIADIPPEVSKWTFQSVSYFVYGEKINTYSVTDPLQKEFIEAGSEFIHSVARIAAAPPFYRLFPTKPYREFLKKLNRMKKAGLLDQWLRERKFTEEEALALSYDMLSAGIDTIQDRLVQEIDLVVGNKEYPTWEDIQNMPLLRNSVKEIMRLYPVVPLQGRVLKENAIVDGYTIPAGIPTILNMYRMSRDENVFENSTTFIPDRWNRDASGHIHPFSSLPFGFGPRACYGRRLAELEMFVLMIQLLPRYKLSTNLEELGIKYGSPKSCLGVAEIVSKARAEAELYRKCRLHGVIVENMHDVPYTRGVAGPEVTACMTRVAAEVREVVGDSMILGVQILSCANNEALAVAKASDADFVRVEGFVFSHVADEGWTDSCAGELLRYRRHIGAEGVALWTDISKKHCSHQVTSDLDIGDHAKAAHFFLSDGLIVTGRETASAVSQADLDAVRAAVSDIPIILGSGVTDQNVASFRGKVDAMIVGSHFKRNGYWGNDVDPERVERFMQMHGQQN